MTILNNILACVENDTIKNFVFGTFSEHPDNFRADYDKFFTIFPNIANYSFIAGIIIAITIGIMVYSGASKSLRRVRSSLLGWSFVLVWLYGFIVYDIGMCTGDGISLWTNAPMAILYAFKIFLLDSDVSEIHEAYHGSWAYSFNFALVHLLAAIVSSLFVIKYFGFNIRAKWRMRKESLFNKNVDESYVLWGFNDASEKLIESIKRHYKESQPNTSYRIILVRLNNGDDDNPETRTGIGRIFDFLSIPTSELEKLQDIDCLTVGTYSNIYNINANEDEDVLGAQFSLRILKRILRKRTRNKIHMLFLSNNEKENIHAVSLLLKDKSLKDFVTNNESVSKREVVFYCHARYNSVHRVIEDISASDCMKVRVVDSSHINVEMLKRNKDLLPVNFVNVESDATVSSAFNSLVIGFSEVGQDSVRFLYEFGAFVKTVSTDETALRSDFHMHVVDKNMSDLAGTFVANAPSINPSMPFMKKSEYGLYEDNPSALITLHKMDCRSVDFYLNLEKWIKELNYIVIATEDDELNISLAVRAFKAAARLRKDMNNFCILVRTHSDEDGHIRNIAGHYNRIWAAYDAAPEVKGKRIHQCEIKKTAQIDGPIFVFGLDSETYTYDNVIANAIEVKAREYKDRYEKTINPTKTVKISVWDDFFRDIMQLEDGYEDYSPTYFGLMLLRRTQTQDFANSEHEFTKSELVDRALAKLNIDRATFNKLTREANTTQYKWPRGVDCDEIINRIAIVLAQTEHLRWNASHEILGYILSDAKDEVRLKHNCLRDWQELDEETRSYDCNVADFILGTTITPCQTKK